MSLPTFTLARAFPARLPSRVCKAAFHTSRVVRRKVAVVLSGCGVYDGSEVHEAAAILMHLSRSRAGVAMFAPMVNSGVINHLTGQPVEGQTRNVLEESARIARGQVRPLEELNVEYCDAVIFPGGFGAAKTLSTFGPDGANMKVDPQVERILNEFHDAGKPIGLSCIAPVLAAKLFPGCEVTLGQESEGAGRWPHASTVSTIKQMGAKHVKTEVTDIHVDRKNKLITTAAFMCEAPLYEIYEGLGAMVEKIVMLVGDGHK
ncbi:Glutamine amidotransferase-like class 1 domain-containing protein 3A, mitochondrial [Lamellibrachia satsuma]|nr:Glutamine amidotransferase-like class 1 domain-containing protein 3A, mitochondrial [Lamellibrachia satsuma]